MYAPNYKVARMGATTLRFIKGLFLYVGLFLSGSLIPALWDGNTMFDVTTTFILIAVCTLGLVLLWVATIATIAIIEGLGYDLDDIQHRMDAAGIRVSI